MSTQEVLRHGTLSWPELRAFWFVCPRCGAGSHVRAEDGQLSRIRILGAPGPDWEVVDTLAVPGLTVRADPGFLHVWLGRAHFEFAARGAAVGENAHAMTDTITMYRPTGPQELELVRESGFRRWPPRLPDQPIFYPVTNEDYAVQIARDWNVKASGRGFVTRFRVRADYMAQYAIEQVGGTAHTEWWIPAERLEEFNDHIVGLIEVVREFPEPTGERP